MTTFEAIVKVDLEASPDNRAEQIAHGIVYACHLLRDEYGKTNDDLISLLDDVSAELGL
jgi:hypothetical protein